MAEVEQLNLRSLDDQLSQPKKGNNAILLPLVKEFLTFQKFYHYLTAARILAMLKLTVKVSI